MLLERCASYERAHSLTMPSGANAADCYSKVLERDPGNAQAQAGMDSIRVLYAKRVQGMMDRSAFETRREASWSGSRRCSASIRGWRRSRRG